MVNEDVKDNGIESDLDSNHSCPGTAVERAPSPEAVHDESSFPDDSIGKHSDVDDGAILATLGGTAVPDSTDVHPLDPATVTELKDLLREQGQESRPWDVQHQRPLLLCYTKEDWVNKQDEDVILHRLKHLFKSGGLASVPEKS